MTAGLPETQALVEQLPLLVRFIVGLTIFLIVPAISKRLRIPGLVGLILCGVLLGKNGLHFASKDAPVLHFLAELGKLLLLFFAGLEIDLKQFQQDKWRALGFGLATFALPLAAGMGAGYWAGYSMVASLLIGSLLASHTLLGYPIVQKKGLARLPSVSVTVGATIFTDILSLLLLAVCVSVHTTGFSGGALALQLVQLTCYTIVVIFGISRVARRLLRKTRSERDIQMLILLFVVATASILAEAIHLEPIVGAFLAGLAVNKSLHGTPAKEHIELLGNTLFLPAFFFSIGLLLDVPAVWHAIRADWMFVLAITLGLVGSKFVAAWIAGRLMRVPGEERLMMWSLTVPQVAATLAAALVAFETVNAAGVRLIDQRVLSAVLVLMLVTAIGGPILTETYARRMSVASRD